jgi:hypothetical protein
VAATERQEARNQTLFRDLNEQISHITISMNGDLVGFICECSDMSCMQVVELTKKEYEEIRSVATWFPVKPGHETPDIEVVIEENERFAIVEKVGYAGVIAEDRDPRDDGGEPVE